MNLPPKLSLAHLPTPIHKLYRLSAEIGHDIYLWRDDLTGCVESGNKLRKLEFLLADAVSNGATRIITAGGMQSNHTRATSYLARRLGLEVTLIVREPKQGRNPQEPTTGNLLLNQLAGAELKFISYADYQAAGGIYRPFLEAKAEAYRQQGEKPYIIGEGGSTPLGCFGYLKAVEEMLATWKALDNGSDRPDSIFCALGSGGTHAGLYLGCALNDFPVDQLWAVNVCDSEAYFQERVGKLIDDTIAQYELPVTREKLNILDGHFGTGYSIATDNDLRFYARLAQQEGVLLDPTYTGKAFQGMLAELRRDHSRFGERILFLHSGGTFGNFAYAEQYAQALRT